jgi:arylsulfate sulfotransferase
MEPGYTLLDRYARDDTTSDQTYPMIVDAAGEAVWYATFGGRAITQLDDGTLLYRDLQNVMVYDLLGNQLLDLPLADSGEGLHHELVLTDTGTYLSVTRKGVLVEGYPSSETDPGAPPQDVVVADDPVLEFAADGSLIGEWSLMDMLEPTRIGYGSLIQQTAGLDWAHTNAVAVDPRDNTLIASLRHQDAVIKFDPADGSLKWILAPHANWPAELEPYLLEPVGDPFEWAYHMHAPEITPSGTVLLFDNGNFRASPFDGQTPMTLPESYSRAVEYHVDETTMEVSQVWEFSPQGAERLHTQGRGDADMLPRTGNVLSTFSAISYVGGVSSLDLGFGRRHARIIETDHGTPPTRVFDLQVYIPGTYARLAIYRADRIASLYAANVRVSFFVDGFESGDLSAWTGAVQ